ncbi:MAG: hypothetical protein EAX96_06690 [Candidatus Lokiarchaeota archaeon]|nr:hypothetical protein [Candidatus Lokiarchaeota archaeon]
MLSFPYAFTIIGVILFFLILPLLVKVVMDRKKREEMKDRDTIIILVIITVFLMAITIKISNLIFLSWHNNILSYFF